MFLRSLLSVCSIFVLLLSTIVVPHRAPACPPPPPETLLSLYRNSDAIYVGRFDKVEDVEIVDTSENLNIVAIRKYFDVSSALKGDPVKLLALDGQEYRYRRDEPAAVNEESEEEQDYAGYRAGRLRSGDLVLLFVKISEEGESLQFKDVRDGIKKMTPDRLSAYAARIRELNGIFSKTKVDDMAIVEWLVSCAEDPITRWEGAFELQMGFDQLEWAEREKAESAESSDEDGENESPNATGSASGDEETPIADVPGPEGSPAIDSDEAQSTEIYEQEETEEEDVIYASLLTDQHKQRLTNALVTVAVDDVAEQGKPRPLNAGDTSLVEVVSNWGNNVLAKHLLDRLQASAGSPYAISFLMSTVGEILGDDELTQIAEKFSSNNYEDDDAVVKDEESGSESDDAASAEQPDTKAKPEAAGREAEKTEAAAPEAEEAEPKQTYKQLREKLLADFMQRSVVALAIAESQTEKERAR